MKLNLNNLLLISCICISANLFAQTKPKKEETPPTEVIHAMPEVQDLPYAMPVEIDVAVEAAPARERKIYNKPFQFWPSADTVVLEDYEIYLQKKKAKLKNYSTGNFPDLKKPVIKSVNELCYVLENNKKDTIRYYGDGWNERYEYDANANLTNLYVIFEDEKTKRDSAYLTTKYFYEGDKLKLKEFFWWATGDKEEEEELEYYETGKLFKVYYTPLDLEGNEIIEEGRGYRTLYKYEKGVEIEESYERLEDAMNEYVLHQTIDKKLNSEGNVIEKKYTDWPDDKPYNTYHYKYDANGNQIFSGDENSSYTNTFNKKGELETSNYKSGNWTRNTTYTYKYDKHGNWITKEELEVETTDDGKTERIYLWKREIDYFNIK